MVDLGIPNTYATEAAAEATATQFLPAHARAVQPPRPRPFDDTPPELQLTGHKADIVAQLASTGEMFVVPVNAPTIARRAPAELKAHAKGLRKTAAIVFGPAGLGPPDLAEPAWLEPWLAEPTGPAPVLPPVLPPIFAGPDSHP